MGEDYSVSHVPAGGARGAQQLRRPRRPLRSHRPPRAIAARAARAVPVSRLALTDFRSYASALIEPGPGFVLLCGENGAGKTNLLEAVSLLTPGRGLRGAALSEMARQGGSGAVRGRGQARRDRHRHRHAAAHAPERRQVRINGAPASVNSLSRMAVGAVADAGDGPAVHRQRRRPPAFPRPARARAGAGATRTMRRATKRRCGRATSCSPTTRRDEAWLACARAGDGRAWRRRRRGAVADRRGARSSGSARRPTTNSRAPRSRSRAGTAATSPRRCSANRARDAAAGRATEGPHRQDLAVAHRAKADARGALLDRRAEGAAARAGPRPCRAGRRAPRRAADPAARRGRGAPRSEAPRGSVRAARRPRPGVDDGDRSGPVRGHRRRRRASTSSRGKSLPLEPGWTFLSFRSILHCNTRRFLQAA